MSLVTYPDAMIQMCYIFYATLNWCHFTGPIVDVEECEDYMLAEEQNKEVSKEIPSNKTKTKHKNLKWFLRTLVRKKVSLLSILSFIM